MNHRIDRFCSCIEQGTFSKWYSYINGSYQFQCYTIGQPWRVNDENPAGIPFQSCIPAGTYGLDPFRSERWGNTWAFVNPELGVVARKTIGLPDWYRYACLVHSANWMMDVEGCEGPGDGLSAAVHPKHPDDGIKWMVTNSGQTMKKMAALLSKHEVHHVTIQDVGLTNTFVGR
jgi:hypothetical protein